MSKAADAIKPKFETRDDVELKTSKTMKLKADKLVIDARTIVYTNQNSSIASRQQYGPPSPFPAPMHLGGPMPGQGGGFTSTMAAPQGGRVPGEFGIYAGGRTSERPAGGMGHPGSFSTSGLGQSGFRTPTGPAAQGHRTVSGAGNVPFAAHGRRITA